MLRDFALRPENTKPDLWPLGIHHAGWLRPSTRRVGFTSRHVSIRSLGAGITAWWLAPDLTLQLILIAHRCERLRHAHIWPPRWSHRLVIYLAYVWCAMAHTSKAPLSTKICFLELRGGEPFPFDMRTICTASGSSLAREHPLDETRITGNPREQAQDTRVSPWTGTHTTHPIGTQRRPPR